jgi:hypothetical protein
MRVGVEIKIVHCSFPIVGEKSWWRDGYLMLHIVAGTRHPLNAHSCRCLAHFYRALEKQRKLRTLLRSETVPGVTQNEP